jgi:hypothetical protein
MDVGVVRLLWRDCSGRRQSSCPCRVSILYILSNFVSICSFDTVLEVSGTTLLCARERASSRCFSMVAGLTDISDDEDTGEVDMMF